MAYATVAQFVEAFTEEEAIALSNLSDASAQQVDATVLNRALNDASATIDSYLGQRYTLPLPEAIPNVLIRCCLNITRYLLDSFNPREDVRKRYEDELRWLEKLARGLLTLGLPSNDEGAADNSSEFVTTLRIFSDSNLGGFL
ncbi:gp436 family protein [Vacuolonema iberomarrocanum]|uniref:gp436 family protein n=1 Tax=Vacuolonema iberomarrocanum TaxID=3454632 RepID=UPI001A023F51|nr:DUF1320 domain-containing protein [filamentous cyanobacterium LEGE 07170]